MALKTCIECGKEHTDTIANCPHCGFVTKEYLTNIDVKNKSLKQLKVEGFFSTGHPLTSVFKVFGMAITTYIIGMFFYKYMFGFFIIGIFVLLTLPYLYHKRENHKAYKVVSYFI